MSNIKPCTCQFGYTRMTTTATPNHGREVHLLNVIPVHIQHPQLVGRCLASRLERQRVRQGGVLLPPIPLLPTAVSQHVTQGEEAGVEHLGTLQEQLDDLAAALGEREEELSDREEELQLAAEYGQMLMEQVGAVVES